MAAYKTGKRSNKQNQFQQNNNVDKDEMQMLQVKITLYM